MTLGFVRLINDARTMYRLEAPSGFLKAIARIVPVGDAALLLCGEASVLEMDERLQK